MPRPFYEIEKMIREYDDYHAFWLNLVPRLNRGINTEQFYEACLVDSKRDESITVLFLSHDQLVLINSTSKLGSKGPYTNQ